MKFKFLKFSNFLNLTIFIFIVLFSILYLVHGLSVNFQEIDEIAKKIILEIRLPRLLLGLIVGAGLSCSGAVFQGLLRNPLAEPYTLGISGMVVLFVNLNLCLSSIFRFNFNETLTNSFAAFLGSIVSIIFIYSIFMRRKLSISQILLIGIMLNVVAISCVEILSNIVDYSTIYSSKFWLIGNLSTSINPIFYIFAVVVILCIYFFYSKGEIIDILSLGDKQATYLGIDVKNEQKKLFLIASIVVGICVIYSGIIGFIGLMIPHISRTLTGVNNRKVIITSALLGAFYLIVSDFIAKTMLYPKELPVGVITGFLGAIFFVVLVLKRGIYE